METKTIVSVGLSRSSHNLVGLTITDAHSGDRVVTVDFTLEEFALLVTGLHGVKGVASVFEGAVVAKKRVIEYVTCEKLRTFSKEAQQAFVLEHFERECKPFGYELHSDGTSTQQPNKLHMYTIKKYVPVEDPLECDSHY